MSGTHNRLTIVPPFERGADRAVTTIELPPDPVALPAAKSGGRLSPEHADEFDIDGTEAILFALAHAVEQRDRQTAGHCERLAFTSVAIGMAMNLDRTDLLALYRGGYLHDVGK